MAKPKIYILRCDGRYLAYVSFDGTRAMFDKGIAKAYTFTPEQRDHFKKEYPHITGRWVLKSSELKRDAQQF